MKGKLAVSLLLTTLAMAIPTDVARSATAKPIVKTFGELLAEGFQVHSVTVIDQATARRMSGNASWEDDLMLTLTKGSDFAFCHVALSVAASGIGLKNGPCNVAQ